MLLFVGAALPGGTEAADSAADCALDSTAACAAAAAGVPVALLAVADAVKPDAAAAVAALRASGLTCTMLTGDNPRAAAAVGAAVGITDVRAALLPADKMACLAALRAAGAVVAMVGDGVNDGPALAAADVGIAIGAGADVAIDAAGVVLLTGSLRGVPAALALARAAMRRIRANLAASLAFNAAGVPLAAGALYPALRWRLPPEAAAAAMAASSVSVVLSSLSLKGFRSEHFAPSGLEVAHETCAPRLGWLAAATRLVLGAAGWLHRHLSRSLWPPARSRPVLLAGGGWAADGRL